MLDPGTVSPKKKKQKNLLIYVIHFVLAIRKVTHTADEVESVLFL